MLILLQEFKKFLTSLGWKDYIINETKNNISIEKKCSKKECIDIGEYDFTDIFNLYRSSFTMKLRSDQSDINPTIKKDMYNKEDLKDDIEIITKVSTDYIDVEIVIDKSKLIQIVINDSELIQNYNFKLFTSVNGFIDFLQKNNYNGLEDNLLDHDKKSVILIVEDNILLQNDLTLVIGGKFIENIKKYLTDNFTPIYNKNILSEKIRIRNENCNWINGTKWLLPNHLYFDFENFTGPEILENYLLKLSTNIIIPFISNNTLIDEKGLFSSINGYKKIKIYYNENTHYNNSNTKYLYKIYQWLYDGNNIDKLSIFRNISSIFLCEKCNSGYYDMLLNGSQEIYTSTLSNFDTYLKGNVKQYFEESHKAREMISNKCKDISLEISSVIDNMNKNFLTTLGLIMVTIIGYIAKGNIYILKISASIYGVYLIFNTLYYLPFYKFKLNIIVEDYNEHIKAFRKTLLAQDMPDTTMIINSITKFNRYWWCSLIISVLLILITIYSIIYTNNIIYFIKRYIN